MVDDLQANVAKIEKEITDIVNSISKLSTKQEIIELQFAAKQEILNDRIVDKENSIKHLSDLGKAIKDQNDALQKQITGRWSIVTGMLSFVSIMFALNFTYGIFQVKDVTDAKTYLERGSKELAHEAAIYSDVLSKLAHADTLIAEGNRELQRNSYVDALQLAKDAKTILTLALEKTGFSIEKINSHYHYDKDMCKLVTHSLTSLLEFDQPKEDSVTKSVNKNDDILQIGLTPEALQKAVRDALFAAYDMEARATFFMKSKSTLRDEGRNLLILNSSRWEGYHWIGLAAEDEGMYKEAEKCFTLSVNQKAKGNRDYINLAELYFIDEKFSEAKIYAENYVKTFDYKPVSSLDVVAAVYYSLSEYLSPDIDTNPKLPPDKLRSYLGEMDYKLEGTFSSHDLDKYINGNKFKKLTPAKQIEVKKTVNCMKTRKCYK